MNCMISFEPFYFPFYYLLLDRRDYQKGVF